MLVEYHSSFSGQPRRTSRKAPHHPHPLWNYHDAIAEGLPRTNNSVEGWHRGFDALNTRYQDPLWETVQNFKREQGLSELTL